MSEKENTVSSISPENTKDDQSNVIRRVSNWPVVSSTCDKVIFVYNSTKENLPCVKSICNVAEKGVKAITTTAVVGAQPFLNKLEPQITTANKYACKYLDKLEEKLPVLHKPSEEVVADTKELVSNKLKRTWNNVFGADSVMKKVVNVGKDALGGGRHVTIEVVTPFLKSVKECGLCKAMSNGLLHTVLEKSKKPLDSYIPLIDKEITDMETFQDDSNIAPVKEEKGKNSFHFPTSISTNICPQVSLKMQKIKEHTMDGLALLHQTIDLIEYFKQAVDQKLQGGYEKLQQMILERRRKQMRSDAQSDSLTQPEVEMLTVAMFRSLIHEILYSCWTFVSNVHDLPASIQEKVQQVHYMVQDLHIPIETAFTLRDLPAVILVHSHEQLAKAREYLDEMLDYVVQNVPLPWLVGPFAPYLVEFEEAIMVEETTVPEDEEDDIIWSEDEEDVVIWSEDEEDVLKNQKKTKSEA